MPRGINKQDNLRLQKINRADANAISIPFPGIITDGLILYLDAGNRHSYPTSGTTWYDLSGRNFHATLTNGPTFTTDKGGELSTDSTNDYIAITDDIVWDFGTKSFTACVWFKYGTVTDGNLLRHDQGQGGGLWWIRPLTTTLDFWIFDQNRSTNLKATESSITLNDGAWHYAVGVRYSGSTLAIYRNGQLGGSAVDAGTINIVANSSGQPTIGRAGSFNGEYDGFSVGIVQIYDRALSPEEVRQNYLATKARYV